MQGIQFGSFSADEFITLVSEQFSTLGTMEETSNLPTEEDLIVLGMEVDSDDPDLLDDEFDVPSPDTLARERELADHPVLGTMVDSPVPVVPRPSVQNIPPVSCEIVPAPDVQMAPVEPVVVPRASEASPMAIDKEDPKRVIAYLRSCHRDKAILFDGVHDSDKKSVQEAWRHTQNVVRACCALSQIHSNMAKVMFLQAHLSERPLNMFIEEVGKWQETREAELKKTQPDPKFHSTLPPYETVCAVIEREFLAGQRQSMVELTESIFNTRLHMLAEKYGNRVLPTLAQIWQDYKAMFRERASLSPGEGEFDKHTLIFLYLNAIPSNMHAIMRHVKDANGQVKEPTDPMMLENSILALGDQFLIDLRRRREGKPVKGPQSQSQPQQARGSGAGAGPSGSGAAHDRKRSFQDSQGRQKPKQFKQGGSQEAFQTLPHFLELLRPQDTVLLGQGYGPGENQGHEGQVPAV